MPFFIIFIIIPCISLIEERIHHFDMQPTPLDPSQPIGINCNYWIQETIQHQASYLEVLHQNLSAILKTKKENSY